MQHRGGMHPLQSAEQLVHRVSAVDVEEHAGAQGRVQVGLHRVEDEVDVAVVFGAHDVAEPVEF